jgi:sporulation protein YlmC with PRC-barrel domain
MNAQEAKMEPIVRRWALAAIPAAVLAVAPGAMAAANEHPGPDGKPSRGLVTPDDPTRHGAAADVADARAGTARDPRELRVSRLIGMPVEGMDGQRIGEVHDLIVDARDGRVRYAVIDAGGFLGLGEHRTAVSLRNLDAVLEPDHVRVNMTREQLERYPSYPPDREPDWNLGGFAQQVDDAVHPDGNGGATMRRYWKASDLLDADLKDGRGNDIGDVEDLVIDASSGKVRYGAAKFDGSWATPEALVRIDPTQVRAEDGDGTDLVIVADAAAIRTAPRIDENRWERMAGS